MTIAETTITAGRLTLATGAELPYVEQGDPDGMPVLMLHGGTDSLRAWEPMLPHMPSPLRTIAITQRGHRGSGGSADSYEIEDYAADVLATIDALELERPIVVGMSMGALIAEQLLADDPPGLRGVVLVGPIGKGRMNEQVIGFAAEVATLEDPIPREFAHEFQESTIERPIDPELLDLFVDESLGVPARVWRGLFEGLLRWDVSDRLGETNVPVLVAHGDRDAFSSDEETRWLLATLRNARLSTYEGTGHAVHWEEPERLAREIAGFAASL
jgi:non-heme chloroperoxidase